MFEFVAKVISKALAWVDEVTGKEYPSHYIKRSEYMERVFVKWVKGRREYEKWGDNTYVIKLNYNEVLVKVLAPDFGVLKDNNLIRVKIIGDGYFNKGQVIAGVITKKISQDVLEVMPLPFQDKVGKIRIIWK
jgi:myo-inositol-1-phosphate synthase